MSETDENTISITPQSAVVVALIEEFEDPEQFTPVLKAIEDQLSYAGVKGFAATGAPAQAIMDILLNGLEGRDGQGR